VYDFQAARTLLCELVNAQQVEIMMGSGTLANDAIAGQLSLLCKPGLILISGEFGRRLVKNANGAKLFFQTLEIPEGQAFQRPELEKALNENPGIEWVWGTHCETSTGVLNDLEMYKQVCAKHGLKLCMDCISSIGTVPVDLAGVYLASTTSGKGLASIAGLSMVFHNHDVQPAPDDLPCALDLGIYQQSKGIPYTIQSNLVHALLAALKSHDWEKRFEDVRSWSRTIRRKLAEIDAPILAPDSCAMPAVVTIVLPEIHSSEVVGDALKEHGILISYRSSYLLERNWIQACMMGAENKPAEKFVRLLKKQLVR
jgi:aspartate aminotransferase-like enzyme